MSANSDDEFINRLEQSVQIPGSPASTTAGLRETMQNMYIGAELPVDEEGEEEYDEDDDDNDDEEEPEVLHIYLSFHALSHTSFPIP